MRNGRMKIVIQEAAVLAKRKGTEKLTVPNQGSGEEYSRKVLELLEGIEYHVTNSRAHSCHMIMKSRLAQNSLLLARRIVGVKPLEAASVYLLKA